MISITDQIRNVVYGFANAFDEKDWDGMLALLADKVECDYQDLRQSCSTLTRVDYVRLRKNALNRLKTQHLFTNMEIYVVNSEADVRLSAMIFRCSHDSVQFNTHAIYRLRLISDLGGWRISKIAQQVLWNEGDSSIHSGV